MPIWWPGNVKRTEPHVPLVYFDLNHWIELAKANRKKSKNPSYKRLLEICQKANVIGAVSFVLSQTHYLELGNTPTPNQRKSIADVMQELSNFKILLGRPILMRCELRTALNNLSPSKVEEYAPIPLIGHNIFHAMGQAALLRMFDKSSLEDQTDKIRANMDSDEFDKFLASGERFVQSAILRGPKDRGEDAILRKNGYDPAKSRNVTRARAAQEQEFMEILNAGPKAGRSKQLRDHVSARELWIEYKDMLEEEFTIRQQKLDELFPNSSSGSVKDARRFVDSMPGSAVSIAIKTHYHKNSSKTWKENDINDIDAMAVAIPYCDVVFTDLEIRNAVVLSKLPEQMNTAIPKSVEEMIETIQGFIDRSETNP
jgi:arsenate reductase-like glutaredoxin family protein